MNDLIIIGGGAAGLMAAATAGELGLSAILLERRHRPGLKLLMCGNNRCNVSHHADVSGMCRAYGGETGDFLLPALRNTPPKALRNWFAAHGLPTILRGERIYPKTESADDVLHCFLDTLRESGVPLALNCPVRFIRKISNGFSVETEKGLVLSASHILLCTGGVSYPKTGSVGDGQRMAEELGLSVTPLRPGLAGLDHRIRWMTTRENRDLPDVGISVWVGEKMVAGTRGNVLCAGSVLRGSAVFDAVRLLSRQGISRDMEFVFDLVPSRSERELEQLFSQCRFSNPENWEYVLELLGFPEETRENLAQALIRNRVSRPGALLKAMPIPVEGIRPLKEAIVTVGGVSLSEIMPETMESRRIPGLFFAGELLDVDGPTGGYNLHAAFATARLAVQSIGRDSRRNGL